MKIIRMKNTAIVADNIAVIELKDNTLKVCHSCGYTELVYNSEQEASDDMDRLCEFISKEYVNLDKEDK